VTRIDAILRGLGLVGLLITFASLGIGAAVDFAGEGVDLSEWLFALGSVAYAFVGVIVLRRRPRHRVAWLMLAVGVFLSSGFAAEQIAGAHYVELRAIPGALVAAWYMQWYWLPFLYASFVGIILLFPGGHALTPRWGRVGQVALAHAILVSLGGMFAQRLYIDFEYLGTAVLELDNPVGFMPFDDIEADAVMPFVIGPLLIMAISAVLSLILRYRRSQGAERQQMRWGAFALTVTLGMFVSAILLDIFGIDLYAVESALTIVAPVGIGVAITRYRLWDLDRIISRTVAYLVLTAVLAGMYGLLVLATQAVVGPSNLPDLAVAGITLVTAAAFGPARRRVQHLVDRRFNRSRYDAARILDGLAHRLRDEVNPTAVEGDLLLAVEASLQPSHVSLWVPSPGTPRRPPFRPAGYRW